MVSYFKKVPISSNAVLMTHQKWKTLMDQTSQASNCMLLWQTNQIKPPLAVTLEILILGGHYQMKTLWALSLVH
jgi:hypothetical protein